MDAPIEPDEFMSVIVRCRIPDDLPFHPPLNRAGAILLAEAVHLALRAAGLWASHPGASFSLNRATLIFLVADARAALPVIENLLRRCELLEYYSIHYFDMDELILRQRRPGPAASELGDLLNLEKIEAESQGAYRAEILNLVKAAVPNATEIQVNLLLRFAEGLVNPPALPPS